MIILNIEQVWPEWHEDCVLGEGSFGKVYRVKRVERNKVFFSAVKVLTVPKSSQEIKQARAQGMNDAEIYAYFEGFVDDLVNEIVMMDNLKGATNVVGIDDYKIIKKPGEIGWEIFIRMELLTPFDSFATNPEFSQSDVIKLGIDICTALEMCERNQIVHRDIKPDNIFVSKFGEYKLGDFGIARQLDKANANLSRKGTLNYMAPEVYRGDAYGQNVDLYSLGLVLYSLLNNNRVPFLPQYPQPITFKDNEIALTKRLSGEKMDLPCNASRSLGEAIVRACAFRPEDRYQNATDFKNALMREWNSLIASGNVSGIPTIDSNSYASDGGYGFENTTNDMTLHGRVVVDGYNQNTTVLDSYNYPQQDQTFVSDNKNSNTSSVTDYYKPPQKNSKLCRILSIPVAVIGLILQMICFAKGYENEAFGLFSVSAIALNSLWGNSRIAMGLAVIVHSLPQIISCFDSENISALLSVDLKAIACLLGLLMALFGGLSFCLQKEVRLGGTLLLYGAVISVIYVVLCKEQGTELLSSISIVVTLCSATLWAYGYDSSKKTGIYGKIFKIICVAITLVTTALSLFFYYVN